MSSATSTLPTGPTSSTAPVGTEPPTQPPAVDQVLNSRQATQGAQQSFGQETDWQRYTGQIDSERGRNAYQSVEHLQSTFMDDRLNQRFLMLRQQADFAFQDAARYQYLAQQQSSYMAQHIVSLATAGALANAIGSGTQGDSTALVGALIQALGKQGSLTPPVNTGQPSTPATNQAAG